MALQKRNSRSIAVDGITFRYTISCDWSSIGEHDIRITVQQEDANGSRLLVNRLRGKDLGRELGDEDLAKSAYPVVTPKHISSLIIRAVDMGWNHSEPGRDFSLPVDPRIQST